MDSKLAKNCGYSHKTTTYNIAKSADIYIIHGFKTRLKYCIFCFFMHYICVCLVNCKCLEFVIIGRNNRICYILGSRIMVILCEYESRFVNICHYLVTFVSRTVRNKCHQQTVFIFNRC